MKVIKSKKPSIKKKIDDEILKASLTGMLVDRIELTMKEYSEFLEELGSPGYRYVQSGYHIMYNGICVQTHESYT